MRWKDAIKSGALEVRLRSLDEGLRERWRVVEENAPGVKSEKRRNRSRAQQIRKEELSR